VIEGNQQVYKRATSDETMAGMGTTLTLLVIVGTRVHLAHVGDSRAYLFNADGVTDDETTLMRLTSDHSLVARLVDIGQITSEQARMHPQRNMLYRALGTRSTVEIDTSSHPLGVGDCLLLCSDGLIAHVEDDELADMVLQGRSPDQVCASLIALANQRGGRDNISVVLAMVEGIDHHVPL
jgi:protein phosphatase